MDYRREMIENLRNFAAKKASLDYTATELKRLNAEMTRIQSATKDGTPVSGGTNHREDRLVNLIMAKMEIEAIRKETEAWVLNLERALSTLDDEDYRILDVLYIHPVHHGVEKLCDELGCAEESTIYRRKNRLLRRLTLLFYGVIER